MQASTANSPHPDQLYTTEETAKRLCIPPERLRKSRQGKASVVIPFIKVGRSVRYRERDITNYLDKMTATYTSEARVLLTIS